MATLFRHTPDPDFRDCVSYLRKSKGRAGISRQRRDNETIAARLGWRIIAEFIDVDRTAFTKVGADERARRDDYQAMLTMLRADTRDKPLGVLAWHADRLHRSTDEVGEFIAVGTRGRHPVETARSGGYDLTTATGRKRIKQDALDAEFEVDHMVERIEAQKLEAALAGRWLGGRAPFGWVYGSDEDGEKILAQVPEQAAALAEAAEMILDGETLAAVARRWNEELLRRRDGGLWTPKSVRQVLIKPRNAALQVHKGKIIETMLPGGRAEWRPAIEESIWRAMVTILTSPGRKTTPGPAPRWLGSGIYRCHLCGEPTVSSMGSNLGGKRWRIYRCFTPGPGHVSRSADPIDDYIAKALILRMSRPDIVAIAAEEKPPDLDAIRARLKAQEVDLAEWRRLAEAGEVTPVAFAGAEQGCLQRIEEIRAELTGAVRSPLLAEMVSSDDVAEAWERLELGARRTLLRLLVEDVTICKVPPGKPPGWTGGPYWHPESVRIRWRKPHR